MAEQDRPTAHIVSIAGRTLAEPIPLWQRLGELLSEAGATIQFGLRQQGKYETVARMRAEGASWDEIGKAIGWSGSAVERHYSLEADAEWHLKGR